MSKIMINVIFGSCEYATARQAQCYRVTMQLRDKTSFTAQHSSPRKLRAISMWFTSLRPISLT